MEGVSTKKNGKKKKSKLNSSEMKEKSTIHRTEAAELELSASTFRISE